MKTASSTDPPPAMSPRLIDTHCHVDHLDGDPSLALAEARALGVGAFVLPTITPAMWPSAAALAAAHPDVHLGLGLHPCALDDLSDAEVDDALDDLPRLIALHGAVALGEIGLDHRAARDDERLARQRRVFERQLTIALEAGLPPIIHCVEAHGLMLEVWSRHPCGGNLPGVLHAFTGSAEMVARYCRAGLFISFAGPITWPGALKPAAACRAVPDDRLLIETDAPYQSPHPHRGSPNSPDRLPLIAAKVAEVRGASVDAIAALTTENARRLFGLG